MKKKEKIGKLKKIIFKKIIFLKKERGEYCELLL
jgi:hypothetical protein